MPSSNSEPLPHRIFHICNSGKDVEIDDPFASGSATKKPIRYLARVPGTPECAETKYDVCQAMSFVATHRNNTEERVTWQRAIPFLLEHLGASAAATTYGAERINSRAMMGRISASTLDRRRDLSELRFWA